jgi:hypothetical protein
MKPDSKKMEAVVTAKKHEAVNGSVVSKPYLRCHKCHTPFHYRVYPNWIFRNVLFFMPIKVYFCARCLKNRYILITNKEERKFEPV